MTYLDDRDLREGRPSPDAQLQEAQQGSRGRLKIFVGAAPGVGKTYPIFAKVLGILPILPPLGMKNWRKT